MGRSKSSKRRGPKAPPPLRMGPASTHEGGDACVVCGAKQRDKFDSTLMCADGHATCFSCVAAGVQPHALCGHACNGFKYQCGGCQVWLYINKTQELALMCGGHERARERLDEEEIDPRVFDAACAFLRSSASSSEGEGDTQSSSSSTIDDDDECRRCPCAGKDEGEEGAAEVVVRLPRVCRVDWSQGRGERTRRLERLRASLLGL